MSSIHIKELGFAAFLKLNGLKLVSFDRECWVFESEKEENELRIEWVNSEFSKFDKILLDLKNFKKEKKYGN